jgi:hypothetical protein
VEAKHVVSRIPQPLQIHSTRFIKKVGNQQELFLLRISKKKIQKISSLKKKCTCTARALHVQLCSEFTVLVHVHHGITAPKCVCVCVGVGVGVDVVSYQIVYSDVCVTSSTPDHQSLPPPEKTKIHSMMCHDVDILMFR